MHVMVSIPLSSPNELVSWDGTSLPSTNPVLQITIVQVGHHRQGTVNTENGQARKIGVSSCQ